MKYNVDCRCDLVDIGRRRERCRIVGERSKENSSEVNYSSSCMRRIDDKENRLLPSFVLGFVSYLSSLESTRILNRPNNIGYASYVITASPCAWAAIGAVHTTQCDCTKPRSDHA